jgi:hypothetical protein
VAQLATPRALRAGLIEALGEHGSRGIAGSALELRPRAGRQSRQRCRRSGCDRSARRAVVAGLRRT